MTLQSNLGLYFSGTYLPFRCEITDIVSDFPNTIVTTSRDHGFVLGNQVQFLIPKQWGMLEMNNLKGYVLDLTPDTITVTIDSSQFSLFSTPVVTPPIVIDFPQVIPIGDANTGYETPGGFRPYLKIPGTFKNIYP